MKLHFCSLSPTCFLWVRCGPGRAVRCAGVSAVWFKLIKALGNQLLDLGIKVFPFPLFTANQTVSFVRLSAIFKSQTLDLADQVRTFIPGFVVFCFALVLFFGGMGGVLKVPFKGTSLAPLQKRTRG